jgi:hypothetical protein
MLLQLDFTYDIDYNMQDWRLLPRPFFSSGDCFSSCVVLKNTECHPVTSQLTSVKEEKLLIAVVVVVGNESIELS